jgi:hypothetical protein
MARRARIPRAERPKPDPLKWELSAEIASVAAALTARFEVHFSDLRQLRIGYLMIHGGKEPKRDRIDGVWARFMKVPEPYRTLTELDAIVWVRYAIWKSLDDKQRQALIAHQLTHGSTNDKGDLVVLRHDLEDFAWVARQFGAWYEGVELYGKQLSLFGQPDPKGNGSADAFADIDARVADQKAERGNVTPLRPRSTSTDQPQA